MKCQECGYEFHEDHGCGTAVLCGSSYAAHIVECSQMGGLWCKIVNDATLMLHGPKVGYRAWEAPSKQCPVCYHYHGGWIPAAGAALTKMKGAGGA